MTTQKDKSGTGWTIVKNEMSLLSYIIQNNTFLCSCFLWWVLSFKFCLRRIVSPDCFQRLRKRPQEISFPFFPFQYRPRKLVNFFRNKRVIGEAVAPLLRDDSHLSSDVFPDEEETTKGHLILVHARQVRTRNSVQPFALCVSKLQEVLVIFKTDKTTQISHFGVFDPWTLALFWGPVWYVHWRTEVHRKRSVWLLHVISFR